MCVCVCVCFTILSKLSPRKKKLDVNIKEYYFFFAIVSVIQVESIQEDLTESRSLNWEELQETNRR